MSNRINPGVIRVPATASGEFEVALAITPDVWDRFNTLADQRGIGEVPDDYMPWLEMYMTGWLYGYEG